MKFYLGTHIPGWVNKYDVPFFISMRCVLKRKSELKGDWVLDSGGFTEISKHGKYLVTEEEYLECIHNTSPRIAYCQDWMCEPFILDKTQKTVLEHQELTCRSFISLRSKCGIIKPVLQGFDPQDYAEHLKMYRKLGVSDSELFGVGSVCKRNGSPVEIYKVLSCIKREAPNVRLHGFGLKITALSYAKITSLLSSTDSMAWSFGGRYQHLGCEGCKVKNCANCYKFASLWRDKLLNKMGVKKDLPLGKEKL